MSFFSRISNEAPDTPAPAASELIAGSGQLMCRFKTSMGDMVAELYEDKAPRTVANFVALATGGVEWTTPSGEKSSNPLYSGTIFHRVIQNFMLQGETPREPVAVAPDGDSRTSSRRSCVTLEREFSPWPMLVQTPTDRSSSSVRSRLPTLMVATRFLVVCSKGSKSSMRSQAFQRDRWIVRPKMWCSMRWKSTAPKGISLP